MAPEAELHCPRHPKTVTNLRCGKCETLICPQCLVHTPVGARCPDCAQLKSLPQFQVQPTVYAKSLGAAFGAALLLGTVWGFVPFGGFFTFILSMIVGSLISTAINEVSNRRQTTRLKVIAGGAVVLAYLVSRMAPILFHFGLAAVFSPFLGVALTAAVSSLGNPITLLAVAVGAAVAVTRIG